MNSYFLRNKQSRESFRTFLCSLLDLVLSGYPHIAFQAARNLTILVLVAVQTNSLDVGSCLEQFNLVGNAFILCSLRNRKVCNSLKKCKLLATKKAFKVWLLLTFKKSENMYLKISGSEIFPDAMVDLCVLHVIFGTCRTQKLSSNFIYF